MRYVKDGIVRETESTVAGERLLVLGYTAATDIGMAKAGDTPANEEAGEVLAEEEAGEAHARANRGSGK